MIMMMMIIIIMIMMIIIIIIIIIIIMIGARLFKARLVPGRQRPDSRRAACRVGTPLLRERALKIQRELEYGIT